MPEWFSLSVEDSLQAQEVTLAQGLSAQEAASRLQRYGPNELSGKGIKSPWVILWEQLTSVMVLILLAAAGLSAFLGDFNDAIVILAIVVFFAILGLIQEYRAEKAIAALKQLAVPLVQVRREGQRQEISARDLVPGDLVFLETGNIVPADCRLLESVNLKIQEAALTGESEPVEKFSEPLSGDNPALGDHFNMAYMGTVVTYGRGLGLVVATGMHTQLGKIASMLEAVEAEPTPLQKKLDQVGKTLAVLAMGISALIFVLGVLRGEDWKHMLLSAVSVAVAAVPEGLPAVLTITLAFGSQRMLKRHALVRKLTGIETLGSVSVICSDKTGTLTQNRMTVQRVIMADHEIAIIPGQKPNTSLESTLLQACGVLCNDASLESSGQALGDPTETALLIAAQHWNLDKQALDLLLPRLNELPFDSERKRMTTVHAWGQAPLPAALEAARQKHLPEGGWLSLTKGSADGLLELCSHYLSQAGILPLTPSQRQAFLQQNEALAAQGMRVLGFALRTWQTEPTAHAGLESELVFLGMMGMIDPPRPEVLQAIQTCQMAGIRPIMITGDHPLTARAIARALHITENDEVLTGQQLQQMDDQALGQALKTTSVFARVSPEHKLRIVTALQAQHQIVAMTGDGVNDAPALKKADIGVAMGITGTDVSKEAADMVLQDDNFATIVAAVEEGRIIYDNLRKFIQYSVAGNLGKILVMLLAPLMNMPLALLPIQMLWLNLLTDGLLGFGIGMEKGERHIMQRPPVPPDEGIIGKHFAWQVTWMGALIGGISLLLGAWSFAHSGAQGPWQTVFFTSLATAQIFQALAIRSSQDSLFAPGQLVSNPTLWGMIGLVILLQAAVMYLPWFQQFFHTTALDAKEIGVILLANSSILWIAEGLKAMGQRV